MSDRPTYYFGDARDRHVDLSPMAAAERLALNKEAWALLELINAEFQSDPMSVQCFDLRVVDRVLIALSNRRRLDANSPEPMLPRRRSVEQFNETEKTVQRTDAITP